MYHNNIIDKNAKRFLTQPSPKPWHFHILPTIHKQGNPESPIVSSNGHRTKQISQFVDSHLKPLVKTTNSFIKDTTHFLTNVEQLGHLLDDALLVTLAVSSLYTNVIHNEGIDAWRHFLNTRNASTIKTETLCDVICMIFTIINFCFDDKHFLQIYWRAIGSKMARSHAHLFLARFEKESFNTCPSQTLITYGGVT